MTFSIRIMTRELVSAISACAQVVDTASKIPILRTVHMTAADGRLSIIATNTTQTVTARAACSGEGTVCLDMANLDVKVRALRQGDPVEIVSDGTAFVIVSQGRTKWKLPTLMAEDFPVKAAEPVKGKAVKVPDGFMVAMRHVSAGVDPNEPREYLRGVHMADVLVGTNGHMLALADAGAKFAGITIPASAIKAISAMSGDVTATASAKAVEFSTEWMTVRTQVLEGSFPDFRRVVPSDLPGCLVVDRQEFRAAVIRAASIRADGDKAGAYIPVDVKIRDGEIELFASNREGEEGSDFVACDRQSGDDADIRVAGGLLIKAIDSMECETVKVAYKDYISPVVMSPSVGDREDIRIVMPRQK